MAVGAVQHRGDRKSAVEIDIHTGKIRKNKEIFVDYRKFGDITMKLRYLFLLVLLIAICGCSSSSKVRSLSENSGKLPVTEPIDEDEQKTYQSATQHGEEMVFRYEYGAQSTFFKTSQYCYSYGEDALKFVSNDSKSVVTIPLENIQTCVGGTKMVTPKSAGKVFKDHLSKGANVGLGIGWYSALEIAGGVMGVNPVLGMFAYMMAPLGFVVGTSVGAIIGGTAGLVAMGTNYADGTLACEDNFTEEEELEFLMSHRCFAN